MLYYKNNFLGGSEMIKDSEIKAKISPFAIRQGEIKVFDGKDGYVSMNQIMQKINLGHINELHFQIINYINNFEFLTSRQIFQLLQLNNIEIKNQDKLNNKLDQLIKSKILTRYYFTSSEGQGIFRVYAMEKMAKYLLSSREIDCKWQPSDNAKPVDMIKKKLAGNQLLIAYMRKVKACTGYQLKPQITAKSLAKKFKPTLRIDFSFNGSVVSFAYEVVRRNEDWEKQLVDRMNLWKDFYDNFVPGDSGFETIPQLVFVCEDTMHMGEVFKTLTLNHVNIQRINFYYTTDLEQNSDNLANSLYNFVIDNGKYRINKLNAQILGN